MRTETDEIRDNLKYLTLLARDYPSQAAAASEIISTQALLKLSSACVFVYVGLDVRSGCVMRSGCSASLPSRCETCCSISGVGGLAQTRLSAFCAGVRSGRRCLVCLFADAASNSFMSTNFG